MRKGAQGRSRGGGGIVHSPIATEPTDVEEGGDSAITDVVEWGHVKVGPEDAQIVPPVRSCGLPLKEEGRVVSLHTVKEITVRAIMYMGGGVDKVSGKFNASHRTSFSPPRGLT